MRDTGLECVCPPLYTTNGEGTYEISKEKIVRKSALALTVPAMIVLLGLSWLSGAAEAAEKTKIRVAAQATSGQVFQFLAKDKGYLADEGIEVEMIYISNPTDAFSALGAGKVDVVSTYGTAGILMQINNGQKFSVFGGYMIIGAMPIFTKDAPYTGLESFRGRKIAVIRNGTGEIVLRGALYDAGFDLEKDVTFVDVKRSTDILEAVRSGACDFGALPTGFELQLADAGMKIVTWTDELWANHSCCRMASNAEWMEKNPALVKGLLRAYLRAEHDMQRQEGVDQAVHLTMKELDMSEKLVRSFVESPHMKYDADPYKNSVLKMWKKMQQIGRIDKVNVNMADHINTVIYKEALDSLLAEHPTDPFYLKKLDMFKQFNL
jgi:NitT/TauT family transport system substrate-binding protein